MTHEYFSKILIFKSFSDRTSQGIYIYILVINQHDAQNLFYNKFISCLYMFRASYAHRQEVKIVLYSLWYHHACRWPSRARDGHLQAYDARNMWRHEINLL